MGGIISKHEKSELPTLTKQRKPTGLLKNERINNGGFFVSNRRRLALAFRSTVEAFVTYALRGDLGSICRRCGENTGLT